jgi:hypothetical protein
MEKEELWDRWLMTRTEHLRFTDLKEAVSFTPSV